MIGIFGNDDKSPSPEQVNQHEAELEESMARTTSSTATMAPATGFSITIVRPIAKSKRLTAGKKFLVFLRKI